MGTTDGDESPILKFRHTQVAVGSRRYMSSRRATPAGKPIVFLHGWNESWRYRQAVHGVHRALLAAAAMAPASAATWWIQHALNPSVLIVPRPGGAVSLAIYAAVLRVFLSGEFGGFRFDVIGRDSRSYGGRPPTRGPAASIGCRPAEQGRLARVGG